MVVRHTVELGSLSVIISTRMQLRLYVSFGLHGAVLWPAHGTEFSLLVDIGWQRFIVVLLGPLGIKGQRKLLVPVKGVTSPAELVIPITGAGTMSGDIGGMRCDLVSNQALTHILGIGKT